MRVLDFADLKTQKGIRYTRQHLVRLEKQGLFPERRQLGGNRVIWLEDEIDEFLSNLPRGPLPVGPNVER